MEDTKKTIEELGFKYCTDGNIAGVIPKDEVDNFVRREFARSIANFLLNNFDSLPVKYSIDSESFESEGIEIHDLRLILISHDELRRLQAIEEKSNR